MANQSTLTEIHDGNRPDGWIEDFCTYATDRHGRQIANVEDFQIEVRFMKPTQRWKWQLSRSGLRIDEGKAFDLATCREDAEMVVTRFLEAGELAAEVSILGALVRRAREGDESFGNVSRSLSRLRQLLKMHLAEGDPASAG